MPPLYLKVSFASRPARSSAKRISRPRLRNAMIWRRSITVWARNSTSSKIVGSGEKVTVVPGAPARRGPGDLELALGLAAVLEGHLVVLAVRGRSRGSSSRGERVDDRDADAVQAARDLVALAAELAAGVQRRVARSRPRSWPGYWGCSSTGMPRPSSTTRQLPSARMRHVDAGAEAGHRLVHGVVDDLPDQVVEPRRAGRADVHPRADPHRIETLQNGDVAGPVARRIPWSSRPRRLPFATDVNGAFGAAEHDFSTPLSYPTRCHLQPHGVASEHSLPRV